MLPSSPFVRPASVVPGRLIVVATERVPATLVICLMLSSTVSATHTLPFSPAVRNLGDEPTVTGSLTTQAEPEYEIDRTLFAVSSMNQRVPSDAVVS